MNKSIHSTLVSKLRAASIALLVVAALHSATAEPLIKNGQSLAFLGDSITAGGWGSPAGYARLVVLGLATNGIRVTGHPAGIGGHKSDQMLERLERDVLSKKPDWMTLSCGVNDVWHGAKGIPLDQYKTNIAAIVDRAQAAGVKVMLLTSTPIGENLDNANNTKLAAYNDYLRALAKEKKCELADLGAAFHEALKKQKATNLVLTTDGVHMNGAGNRLMAEGVLRAFGLSDAQLARFADAWPSVPGGASLRAVYPVGTGKKFEATKAISARQLTRFTQLAEEKKLSVSTFADELFAEELKALLKSDGRYADAAAVFEAKREKAFQDEVRKRFSARVDGLLK